MAILRLVSKKSGKLAFMLDDLTAACNSVWQACTTQKAWRVNYQHKFAAGR